MDDVSKSISARLTVLVEQLIVDAIQRQDEGLTKKTVPVDPKPETRNPKPETRKS